MLWLSMKNKKAPLDVLLVTSFPFYLLSERNLVGHQKCSDHKHIQSTPNFLLQCDLSEGQTWEVQINLESFTRHVKIFTVRQLKQHIVQVLLCNMLIYLGHDYLKNSYCYSEWTWISVKKMTGSLTRIYYNNVLQEFSITAFSQTRQHILRGSQKSRSETFRSYRSTGERLFLE